MHMIFLPFYVLILFFGVCLRAPEFDMSELESLFSAAAPNSDLGGKSGRSNRRSGPKPERVQLVISL